MLGGEGGAHRYSDERRPAEICTAAHQDATSVHDTSSVTDQSRCPIHTGLPQAADSPMAAKEPRRAAHTASLYEVLLVGAARRCWVSGRAAQGDLGGLSGVVEGELHGDGVEPAVPVGALLAGDEALPHHHVCGPAPAPATMNSFTARQRHASCIQAALSDIFCPYGHRRESDVPIRGKGGRGNNKIWLDLAVVRHEQTNIESE